MNRRFVSLWFPHLTTDWFALRQPQLRSQPFVLSLPVHGRLVITAANSLAEEQGIHTGMPVADARALFSSVEVLDDKPDLATQLLHRLAEWSIRFTPSIAIDPPNGLLLDASGCAHLWGGEQQYIERIVQRFGERSYPVRAAMADTIGAAWAQARYGSGSIIAPGQQVEALSLLPPAALRLEAEHVERLHKLGLRRIGDFISMPRAALRRRFGPLLPDRLDQACGQMEEWIEPIIPVVPFQERLPCLEPIVTATGIAIALERLLEAVCGRLQQEQKGLRQAQLTCYRVDGHVLQVRIETTRPSHHVTHLFKLFELKIPTIEPGLGIELFLLEAPVVEDHTPQQEKIWENSGGLQDRRLSELLDRLSGRLGAGCVQRYLPDEHHWPERSARLASPIDEGPTTGWNAGRPRPVRLLAKPEPIHVAAPIPDYPPMLFRHKGQLHTIKKADGPERIEAEWWLEDSAHRDYYAVEDEEGRRYWLFRSGHYDADKPAQWFLHGFFA